MLAVARSGLRCHASELLTVFMEFPSGNVPVLRPEAMTMLFAQMFDHAEVGARLASIKAFPNIIQNKPPVGAAQQAALSGNGDH